MRLIEFDPRGYHGLRDAPVIFTLKDASELRKDCSVRFLVGVNGTGKTTLLRFIASVFAALDEDYRRPRPESPAYSAPFSLLYQMRGNTINIFSEGRGRSSVTIEINGEPFEAGDLPGKDITLPAALLICTSGDIQSWRSLLQSDVFPIAEGDVDHFVPKLPDVVDPEQENPIEHSPDNLTPISAAENAGRMGDDQLGEEDQSPSVQRVILVDSTQLPLALLAACIGHRVELEQGKAVGADFERVLKQVGITRLISFSLRLAFDPNALTRPQRTILRYLYNQATLPLKQFDEQLWVFDFDDVRDEQQLASRLAAELDPNGNFQPFQLFQSLIGLQVAGILRQVNLIIGKKAPQNTEAEERTLLAASLSDGERAFLERMSLIHLLREPESLFLFDEPETHFNDSWKRELVNQVEQTLAGTRSEIILTTHAGITLSDAFPEEVILLSHRGQEQVPLTLATEPGELLRSVFGADYSVGERAEQEITRTIETGTDDELRALLTSVGPGYFRIKVVEELSRRVSSRP
jgi:ABC-type cobalamin/Fe3+-siderophores transport system ATPase subunit